MKKKFALFALTFICFNNAQSMKKNTERQPIDLIEATELLETDDHNPTIAHGQSKFIVLAQGTCNLFDTNGGAAISREKITGKPSLHFSKDDKFLFAKTTDDESVYFLPSFKHLKKHIPNTAEKVEDEKSQTGLSFTEYKNKFCKLDTDQEKVVFLNATKCIICTKNQKPIVRGEEHIKYILYLYTFPSILESNETNSDLDHE